MPVFYYSIFLFVTNFQISIALILKHGLVLYTKNFNALVKINANLILKKFH